MDFDSDAPAAADGGMMSPAAAIRSPFQDDGLARGPREDSGSHFYFDVKFVALCCGSCSPLRWIHVPPLGISQVINDQCCRRHILGFLRHYQGATNASGTMKTLMAMAAAPPCSTVRCDWFLLACQCSL